MDPLRAVPPGRNDSASRGAVGSHDFHYSPNAARISRSRASLISGPLLLIYYRELSTKGHSDLAIAFAGPEHILAGSDYPHQIGSIPFMLDSIAALDIAESDRAAILGGNAATLLAL